MFTSLFGKMVFRKSWPVLLVLALLAVACVPLAPATPVSAPATSTPVFAELDGLGRQVVLPVAPQRIVSLAPSNTEILFAVGAGAQVVGRDDFSDYPAEALGISSIGGSMGQYNQEAILALQPDLVLAAEINPPQLVAALEQLGLNVYYLPNPTTLEQMYANLETVGRLSGHESEAKALVASLQARVAAVDARVKTLSNTPSVFYELDSTDPSKPYTAGGGTFVDLLIGRAGGRNVAGGLTTPWAQVGLEQLLAWDPQIILLGDAAWGATPESVAARPGWNALTAVQQGKVFPFDDNLVSRPGPRLVDGLEQLARLLHPDLFK